MATGKVAKKMTKSALATELGEKTGTSKKTGAAFLDALCTISYREAKKAGDFTVPGLGKLVKSHRKARKGRNPLTGAEIKIPAKTVVKFRVAKAAKDAILGAKK